MNDTEKEILQERLPLKEILKKQFGEPNDSPDDEFETREKPRARERFTPDETEEMLREFSMRFQEAFRGLNPTDIGRRLKTTDATVRPYLEGKRFPIFEFLVYTHIQTGVSLDWLILGKGKKFIIAEDDYTGEEREEITEMARRRGNTFQEQVRKLAIAGLEFLRRLK